MKTLLELFNETPDLIEKENNLSTNLLFPQKPKLNEIYEKLKLKNWKNKKFLLPVIGETFNKQEIFFNVGIPLNNENNNEISPYSLITGNTGTGKTTLLRTIVKNSIENEIKSMIITLQGINEFSELETTSKNIQTASNLMDAYASLVKIENIAKSRIALLEKIGKNLFIDLEKDGFLSVDNFDNKPIYLIIDEISNIFYNTPDWYSTAFIEKLTEILQIGKTAGIYVFVSTQRIQKDLIPGSFLAFFERRVIMGNKMSYEDTKNFLNVGFDGIPNKLMNNGVGVVSVHGESPTIFQTFN